MLFKEHPVELRPGMRDRSIERREISWEAVIVTRVETIVLWTRVAVVKNRVIWHGSFGNGARAKESRLESCFW